MKSVGEKLNKFNKMKQDEWLLHYIDQHYLAEQAEVLLQQCLEQRSAAPLQALVERLVVEGPHNLPALHAMWKVIAQRRTQIEQDAYSLWHDLRRLLAGQGLPIPANSPWEALYLDDQALERWAIACPDTPGKVLDEARRALRNTQALLQDMREAWTLLRELEEELEGWAWGLARLAALSSPPFEQVL